jgi:hypothetical protein
MPSSRERVADEDGSEVAEYATRLCREKSSTTLEDAEASTVVQSVVHEVHAPVSCGLGRHGQGRASRLGPIVLCLAAGLVWPRSRRGCIKNMVSCLRYRVVTAGRPIYNGATSLNARREALLSQDYPNLQSVMSDKPSTASTRAIYHDSLAERIRAVRRTPLRGSARSACHREVLCFCVRGAHEGKALVKEIFVNNVRRAQPLVRRLRLVDRSAPDKW